MLHTVKCSDDVESSYNVTNTISDNVAYNYLNPKASM